jgi:hypothetical protein
MSSLTATLMDNWENQKALGAPTDKPRQIWRDKTRSLWLDDRWGPAVPYPPADRASGATNHGYARLKGNPALLNRVPELQDVPEFLELIRQINAGQSPIESVGCEKFYDDDPKQALACRYLTSYTDIIFTRHALNGEPGNFVRLAARLLASVEGCEVWWGTVELAIQRLKHLYGVRDLFNMTIRVFGNGRNDEEARKYWAVSLGKLGVEIEKLRPNFPET